VAGSSPDETLEKLLADYRQSGVDSEGRFTLNPARAREMLERFQLPEPAFAALHLVSFLIGAGAREVKIRCQGDGLVYQAPGAKVEAEPLASPYSALLKSNVPPYLSELALALSAIHGQRGSLQLCSEQFTATYSPEEVTLGEPSPGEELRLTVSLGGARELQLIREHFVLSPIPLVINGEPLVAPEGCWSPAVLQVSLESAQHPLPELPAAALQLRQSTRAGMSALLRLGRQASGARVLFLGRLYTVPLPWECQLPGWQVEAVLCTDRLHKDLSQQSLREDQTFRNMFAVLQQLLESALLQLPLTVWQDRESQALWDAVIALLAQRGELELACQRQQALLRVLTTAPDDQRKANALLRLGLLMNLRHNGSGSGYTDEAELILMQEEPWDASLWTLKARMGLARATPELETAVQQLAEDRRTTPQDRLDALAWLQRRALAKKTPRRAELACRLARGLQELGRSSLALRELESYQAMIERDPELQQESLEVAAQAWAELGYHDRAVESLGRLLKLQRDRYGQYSLRLGLTLTRLAALLKHLGQERQAREYRDWSQRLHE
jgi:hypothetical protein